MNSTPPVDTSTAGEWKVYGTSVFCGTERVCHCSTRADAEAACRAYEVSLDALREQLAREQQAAIHIAATCLLAGAKGEDGSITSAVDELARKLTKAEPALKTVRDVAQQEFANKLRAILKDRSRGEVETWGFVAAFMQMIDSALAASAQAQDSPKAETLTPQGQLHSGTDGA